jgi:flagellar hook-length control protein FliK
VEVKNSLVSMLLNPTGNGGESGKKGKPEDFSQGSVRNTFHSHMQTALKNHPQKSETKIIDTKEVFGDRWKEKQDVTKEKSALEEPKEKEKINTKDKDKKNTKVDKNEKTKEIKETDNTKEKELSEETEVILETIAQLLGIQSNQLQKLLQDENVSLDELTKENMPTIVAKLGEMLDLTKTEMKNLEKMLTEVFEKVEEKIQITNENTVEETDEKKENGNAKEIKQLVNEEVEKVKISRDGIQLREKVEKGLQETSNTTQNEAETTLDDAKGNSESKENSNISVKEYGELKEEKTLEDKQVTKSEKYNGQSNQSSSNQQEQSAFGQNKGKENKSVNNGMAKVEGDLSVKDSNEFQNTLNNSNDKINLTRITPKNIQNTPNFDKNDIINQVIQKAKVSLNGAKSEMILELKPESLGKLQLKVVSERGVIVAKIVAENEQVKAILESNMQTLKEELQKQGMQIEGFSVSVGDESSLGDKQNKHSNRTGNTEKNTKQNIQLKPNSYTSGYAGEILNPTSKNNYYGYQENSIDLTA